METDKLQAFLLKYGSTPQKSVKLFIIGLLQFFAGLILIYLALNTYLWLQIVGLVIMASGVLFALKGYLGILTNRLAFFRHQSYQSYQNRQKYKHLE